MQLFRGSIFLLIILLWQGNTLLAQPPRTFSYIQQQFQHPGNEAKPWVFWYWMHGAVSQEGITADLEAMKAAGIGGAYLMPIKDTTGKIPFSPVVRQLTPEWWAMVRFAMKEAKRLQLKLGMHVSDGFALAGGPWITPAFSMQQLTWSKYYLDAPAKSIIRLPQPPIKENFYKDIAVFAYPARAFDQPAPLPVITDQYGKDISFLAQKNNTGKQVFKSDTNCYFTCRFDTVFTCRSITIRAGSNNYQAQRLILQTSNDGIQFITHTRLSPPRHGWQDTEQDYTHSIPPVSAKYFRLVYDKAGSEPGAEDLDAAKWKSSLRLSGCYLSSIPVINQYEAKNGSVWRIATPANDAQVKDADAVPLNSIIDITRFLSPGGVLQWKAPPGNWVIVRIGHTSTGLTNYTGGGALGLECDKFNATAVKLQFDNWFAKAFTRTDQQLAQSVLKVFHVDSWECGSQNWSDQFPAEFRKRRGYDLLPYLLTMTGTPVESVVTSEKILHDVRTTIAELVSDVFYRTLKKLSAEKGCLFSAEAVAPTMTSDGMLHYRHTDLPMGEFWLNSPTHDKPNDMADAISGAHIYGKNIIQAEAFTSVRMNWAEHPGALKQLGDLNFAKGVNRLALHVFTHNPWMNKQPGMTLDGVGVYFQRDQTWWKQGKVWIDYLTRCQALLQLGKPVADIAVFTGEEIPRRAVLPQRLLHTLPGIFGEAKINAEKKRLANDGQPLRQKPDGVTHSANMADPEDWIDPLNGYQYDSFNPDALMQMQVVNGKIVLPGGAVYKVLVFPSGDVMNPAGDRVSEKVLRKIISLVQSGAKIILGNAFISGNGKNDDDATIRSLMQQLKTNQGKGNVHIGAWKQKDFQGWNVPPDVLIENNQHDIAWTHRRLNATDIYFISNQSAQQKKLRIRLSAAKQHVTVLNPVTGTSNKMGVNTDGWITFSIEASGSLFIITDADNGTAISMAQTAIKVPVEQPWQLQFDTSKGGPAQKMVMPVAQCWTTLYDSAARFYSGTVVYSNYFVIDEKPVTTFLHIDSIFNIATVKVNGVDCGTMWTYPYQVDISKAVKKGNNRLEIHVTNTWHNRLILDDLLPEQKKLTWTTAPFRLKGKSLLPAGIKGNIWLQLLY